MITILLKKILSLISTSFDSIITKLNSIKTKTEGGITPTPSGPTQYYLDDVWNGSIIKNEYVAADGSFVPYGGWDRTDYIDVHGLEIVYLCGTILSGGSYNGFYDENKNFINTFTTQPYQTIPENAYYMVISRQATIWGKIFRYINTEA
jgi:hypothetical protein|nr:MAG TPA: hypothetical protein [Caudoviricetes sp.]